MEITNYVNELCSSVKSAQLSLSCATAQQKNDALTAISKALTENASQILSANELDLACAKENGVPDTMRDRLKLTPERIKAIADAIMDIVKLPDPCGSGEITTRPNGLKIMKTSVPIGCIGIIYEARPNVTVDAAALCLKSGNGVVLKGGKEAINTNRALMSAMKGALASTKISPDVMALIDSTERAATTALMNAKGLIDVLIPRGGKGLIQAVCQNATVPVIETGAGNCHLYVDEYADLEKAVRIAINAKMSRPSVCNAIETILVHSSVAKDFLTDFAGKTAGALEIRGCDRVLSLVTGAMKATEQDYDTEYNDYIVAIKVVDGIDEAIAHIRRYTTGHSEAIVTEDLTRARMFTSQIDCAAVYVNASTRFTDGGEFGFGAEIGISTQKLHARGPMGLAELTTVKYIVEGSGQVR